MANFIMIYRGPEWDMKNLSEADMNESRKQWESWMKNLGENMVEFGAPTANGVSVIDNGSTASASDVRGYSLIKAENIDKAKELLKGHPHLNGSEGKYSIELFELIPMQM
jgi:hypothetical protein